MEISPEEAVKNLERCHDFAPMYERKSIFSVPIIFFKISNGKEEALQKWLRNLEKEYCSRPREFFCTGMPASIRTDSKFQGVQIGFHFVNSCTDPTALLNKAIKGSGFFS